MNGIKDVMFWIKTKHRYILEHIFVYYSLVYYTQGTSNINTRPITSYVLYVYFIGVATPKINKLTIIYRRKLQNLNYVKRT